MLELVPSPLCIGERPGGVVAVLKLNNAHLPGSLAAWEYD